MGKRRCTLTSMKKILLDSSVLFTAVNSPTGGSAKLFTLQKIKLYTSPLILTEVERNVRKKLSSYKLDRFFMLAEKLTVIETNLHQKDIKKAEKVIAKKDAPILADAKNSGVDILITLDKKDFIQSRVEKFLSPKKIMTPKMLIEIIDKKIPS